ncbi:MAG: protein kinase [Deltaproteobacteria bacterium]|nr:protein kinase [Deltaproteobacteria bacterium]
MSKFCAACGARFPELEQPVSVPAGLIGRRIADKYLIVEQVGEGGMGAVYKAEQLILGRLVAIKVLHRQLLNDETAVARFRSEARVASRLNHPNSIAVLDFGQTPDGLFYLVTEYLDGQPLSDILADHESLPVAFVVTVMDQVLAAIEQAHELGLVHRDLKPENIFVERFSDGTVMAKVLDFGIVKDLDVLGPGLTTPGMVCGTPEYMAPEQARGKTVGPATDVYALGVVFYELLTGINPFERGSAAETMVAQLRHEPRPLWQVAPSGIPNIKILSRILEGALSKKVEDRYENASLFRKDLLVWSADLLENVEQGTWNEIVPARTPRQERAPLEGSAAPTARKEAESSLKLIRSVLDKRSTNRVVLDDDARVRDVSSADRHAPPFRERPELVGRSEDLAVAQEALSVSPLVNIWGEPGVGKSHFLRVLADQLRADGSDVLLLSPDDDLFTESLGTLGFAAAPLLELVDGDESECAVSSDAQVLGRADLSWLRDLVDGRLSGTTLPEEVVHREQIASWANLIFVWTHRSNRTVLLLDDMDRYDSASQEMLRTFFSMGGMDGLHVVFVSSRPVELAGTISLQLEPLNVEQAAELAAWLLKDGPAKVDEAAIHLAAGNAFFIQQAVLSGPDIERHDPAARRIDLLDRRLRRLAGSSRWVLQAAAVIRGAFTLDEIHRILCDARHPTGELVSSFLERDQISTDQLREHLDALVDHGFLKNVQDDRWVVSHRIVSQAVEASIPAGVRSKLHEARLVQIASRPMSMGMAAEHALSAGLDTEAIRHAITRAAARAQRLHDYPRAIRLWSGLLNRLRRGWSTGGVGNRGLVDELCQTARALAASLLANGDSRQAESLLRDLTVTLSGEASHEMFASLLLDLASIDLESGRIELAVDELGRALEFVQHSQWWLHAAVSSKVAALMARRGNFEAAVEYLAEAMESAGTHPGSGNAFLWQLSAMMAELQAGWGRAKDAMEYAQNALLTAEEYDDKLGQGRCHELLARLMEKRGRSLAALSHWQSALDIFLNACDRERAAKAAMKVAALSAQPGQKGGQQAAELAWRLAVSVGNKTMALKAERFGKRSAAKEN